MTTGAKFIKITQENQWWNSMKTKPLTPTLWLTHSTMSLVPTKEIRHMQHIKNELHHKDLPDNLLKNWSDTLDAKEQIAQTRFILTVWLMLSKKQIFLRDKMEDKIWDLIPQVLLKVVTPTHLYPESINSWRWCLSTKGKQTKLSKIKLTPFRSLCMPKTVL